ncbi:MAG: hypothetical protein HY399_00825 [Elusimicrobia bacterium]|nr:hypothetical protein [Elusimicrobiota bacterium]
MSELGAAAKRDVRVYFTGGATAVLIGWRTMTIDVDIKILPVEDDELLKAMRSLKETLQINVEFASPDHFIPPLSGWEERSLFVAKEGKISFYHYDLYAQALAKIERGHQQDLEDVREMLGRRLVDSKKLMNYYQQIEPQLYRYPAVDPTTFRHAVEELIQSER